MSIIIFPMELFTSDHYNALSAEAKLLYGFLLNRHHLSEKNKDRWTDRKTGRVYIVFPIAEICSLIGCGQEKARNLLASLSQANLLTTKRQGLCKANMIFVNDVFQNIPPPRPENQKSLDLDHGKSAGNNYTSKQDSKNYIYLQHEATEGIENDMFHDLPLINNPAATRALIHENIEYDKLIQCLDSGFVDSVVQIMTEAVCAPYPTSKIGGIERSRREIYDRIMKITDMHFHYLHLRIARETQHIRSFRGYVLMHLFLSESEIDIFYTRMEYFDNKKEK